MKILHTSDLHFGKTLYQYSLLEDQRFWCRQLLEHLAAEKYDAVVLAGDLFDRSVPSAEAVALLDWFLSSLVLDLGLPVLAVSGNHDSPQRLAFGSRLYQAGGLEIAALPQREIRRVTLTDAWGPVDFFLLPYLSPADGKNLFPQGDIRTFQDVYAALLEANRPRFDSSRRSVLVGHGFFAPLGKGEGQAASAPDGEAPADGGLLRCGSEAAVGGLELVDAALLEGFDYAALGHLHAPQRAGREHLRYSGSPLPYSLSEEGQAKGVTAVELGAKGELSVTRVELPALRRVRTVSGTLEELLAPTQGGFGSGDYVFIRLVSDDTVTGASEKLRNVYPNYLAIRYLTRDEGELALEGGRTSALPLPDAFARFCAQVAGEALTQEELALVRDLAAQKGGEDE